MANSKTFLGKKAAGLTVRHFFRDFRSKVQRQPLRSATLLSAGATLGVVAGGTAGWLVGRKSS